MDHPLVGRTVVDTTTLYPHPEYVVGKTGFMTGGDFTPYDDAFPGPEFFEAEAFKVKPEHMSFELAEVVDAFHYRYTQWAEATTLVKQALAFTAMHDAVGDLCSWHPEYDIDQGDLAMPWQRTEIG